VKYVCVCVCVCVCFCIPSVLMGEEEEFISTDSFIYIYIWIKS